MSTLIPVDGSDEASQTDCTMATSRNLGFSPDAIWAALVTPARLARWWGPEGFSNAFSLCEMKPGGRWVFDMIGPDGKRYANESVFETLDRPKRWEIRHTVAPLFRLSITLSPIQGDGTLVRWVQRFEDPAVAAALRRIVVDGNEQNLDRLHRELQSTLP